MVKFRFLEHIADIKFQAYGKTLNEAFENAALAMSKAMYGGKINPAKKKKIKVKGKDLENLLYNFLEEMLFFLDTESFFTSKVKVKLNEKKLELKADLEGDDASNYSIGLDVKAVTYSEMFVKVEKNKYTCQVVLDV